MGCILKGGGGLYSRLVVGAVVLAAGEGRRMGSIPKSLIEIADVPLIKRQLIALSGAGIDELVVVTGHHREQIEAEIAGFPITITRNEELGDSTQG
ncbi:MAG: NTP transferase domain-containing protein, partial [Gammaproteobacteria bacterium]